MKSTGRIGPAATSHTGRKRAMPGDVPAAAGVTPERIRVRAYEIFLARKGAPGDPVTDWLQAERELRDGALRQAGVTKKLEVTIPRGEVLLRDDE